MNNIIRHITAALCLLTAVGGMEARTVFHGDFSPQDGLLTPVELAHRSELCLNGSWDLQIMPVPESWRPGTGIAPELPMPLPDAWEEVKIKIPSPINVNDWGRGLVTGEGTDRPYVPSSVYFPSYPRHWAGARMAWLRRSFPTPDHLDAHRVILHFEAVAGDARVLVNGHEATTHFGLHLPFEADITDLLHTDGTTNELLVGVRDTRLFDHPHPDYPMMHANYPPGSNTDYLLGIWQDVYLHTVPDMAVSDIYIKPSLRTDSLRIVATVTNRSAQPRTVTLEAAIREWINLADTTRIITAPIPDWELGDTALTIAGAPRITLAPGDTRTLTLSAKTDNRLEPWTPENPNLYTAIVTLSEGKRSIDLKAERFGWREFYIDGRHFYLNGKRIQCFGDIQHPFSAYIASRRFAYAWYRMIKDFGGNTVRPHAQPWPRVYYDLADEMGLMVLDETGLFGSSIRLNFEDPATWANSAAHLRDLILRDRNHPSVIGWSVGNETFAIALLNKPPEAMAAAWNDSLAALAAKVTLYDDTRDFITLDGDRDLDGRMPVWSRHLAHGLELDQIPVDNGRPLVVGESGATYYGKPEQLYRFSGDDAYRDYRGRNRALAIDVYQNVTRMALPMLDYYSPSEVCWFGLEHLPLGYDDFSRLPGDDDGIFAGMPYREGKPGYQYERIPPYVTTFNPGLDPALPLYRPLPMFLALQSALHGGTWEPYTGIAHPDTIAPPAPRFDSVWLGDSPSAIVDSLFRMLGVKIASKPSRHSLAVVDASGVSRHDLQKALKNKDTRMLAIVTSPQFSTDFSATLPADADIVPRKATAMKADTASAWSRYFTLPDLYFAESGPDRSDRYLLKHVVTGDLLKHADIGLRAADTDWSLFNNVAEHWKCAQVCLYEALEKPDGAALLTFDLPKKSRMALTTVDPSVINDGTLRFWRRLLAVMGVDISGEGTSVSATKRAHDLLMDGPMD